MKTNNSTARQYFRAFYENNHLRWALAMLFTLLSAPGMLLVSWVLGAVLDAAAAGDGEELLRLLWITVGILLYMTAADLGMYRMKSAFIHRALAQYKSLAFRNLSEKSISAFSRENTGRYISVLTNDVSSVEENYLNRSFQLVFHCLMFAGALVMMCWYSPLMTLAAVGLSALPLVASLALGGGLAKREKAVSDQNERFVFQVKDLLSGFSVIKSFKAEKEARRLFDQANADTEHTKLARRWWECLLVAVSESCGSLMQFGVFFVGAVLAIRGSITAGTVLVMTNLCNALLQPIRVVPQYWASRKAAKALVEKLAAITEENAGRQGEAVEPVLNEAVTLEHVSFGYEADTPVLKDISLRFDAGKKYALVGASGSGKSTLLNLLMGAYESYEGAICLDGRELRSISTDSLYDVMSLIGQNVFLFDDTIRRNISMFREFPDDQMDSAVKRSGLSEVIARKGEDYRCGENGVGLSGGERQRVSIARCLLRGTPVLMLDEATASLDNQTAFEVTEAILRLEGLTCMVVTHRLEAVLLEQYDEIVVLRGGEVCERGTFADLMEAKGYFYSLYNVSNG